MSYNIIATPRFKKEIKKLLKKYSSLEKEYLQLVDSLEQNPKLGVPMGKGCYKIRVSIASKGKGKSGGARVITHLVVLKKEVYLLTIYDKSKQEAISDKELLEVLKNLQS